MVQISIVWKAVLWCNYILCIDFVQEILILLILSGHDQSRLKHLKSWLWSQCFPQELVESTRLGFELVIRLKLGYSTCVWCSGYFPSFLGLVPVSWAFGAVLVTATSLTSLLTSLVAWHDLASVFYNVVCLSWLLFLSVGTTGHNTGKGRALFLEKCSSSATHIPTHTRYAHTCTGPFSLRITILDLFTNFKNIY